MKTVWHLSVCMIACALVCAKAEEKAAAGVTLALTISSEVPETERVGRVSDHFEMFLMFKPTTTDAIWIPLKRVQWGWSAVAVRSGSSNTWNLVSSNASTPSVNETSSYPAWVRNVTDNVWVRE